ncbi:sel1 repeat family protein [Sneathiella marina]|uniref:Sel1 repeat family protein n=1 Tax=Sneathiella marina TaxID=2950108 RepID=A0ABY4W5S9_9PROT|nr:tetratricopeptide repeat protein [Sneathiella marina]USG62174.1 sel1 repeat family protein [Sneathiella marina]
MKYFVYLFLLMMPFGLLGNAQANDFHEGVRILDSGDSIGALTYFKRCAGDGETRCQVAYASFLERGEGVAQDYSKALELYQKAAESGDATAQLNLGAFFENGYGVEADLKEAVIWYSLAARQGRDWALARKDMLITQLGSEDLLFIDKRLADYK